MRISSWRRECKLCNGNLCSQLLLNTQVEIHHNIMGWNMERARAVMGAAYVPDDKRGKVVIEAIKCATMLDGLTMVKLGDKDAPSDMHVFGTLPKWSVNLRT